MVGWSALRHGLRWPGAPLDPLGWHVHEMLVGFFGAAAAGFLLTASAAWTGRAPLSGYRLGLLAAAWCAGRVACGFGAAWPDGLVAALDLLFPLGLLAVIATTIVASGNRPNLPLVLVVAAVPLANLAYHFGPGIGVAGARHAGIVVHGPLLAQMLMHLAEEQTGPLSAFEFRATAPLYHHEAAELCWNDGALWVRGPDGRQCMQATAC